VKHGSRSTFLSRLDKQEGVWRWFCRFANRDDDAAAVAVAINGVMVLVILVLNAAFGRE